MRAFIRAPRYSMIVVLGFSAAAVAANTNAPEACMFAQNLKPTYPEMSRRLSEQGKTILQLRISAEGKIESIQLHASSGFPRLDEAAFEAVKDWCFIPARRNGESVRASLLVPLVFKLDPPDPQPSVVEPGKISPSDK